MCVNDTIANFYGKGKDEFLRIITWLFCLEFSKECVINE